MISEFVCLTLLSLGMSGKRRLRVARILRGPGSDGDASTIIAESTADPFDIALVPETDCDRGNRKTLRRPFFRLRSRRESHPAKVDRPRPSRAGRGAGAALTPPARGAMLESGSGAKEPGAQPTCLVLPR